MQDKIEEFKNLIHHFSKKGEISHKEYEILYSIGRDLELDKTAVDMIVKIQNGKSIKGVEPEFVKKEESTHEFKSAITRGGSILTPDRIIINQHTVTYQKRNKYLINVDSISIPIQQISSVNIDTSILGTTIKIFSFGSGLIEVKKFTKADAISIKRIIETYQSYR